MSHYVPIHQRQVSSGKSSGGGAQPTAYTTITSTLPWGVSAYTYTQPEGNDGTATVVFAVLATSISATFFVTTTVPSGSSGYTSTFTANKSAAITEVIGVTSGGSATLGVATESSTPSSSPTAQPSSGLSTGAQASIGVAVPLVFILFALGLFWYFRRRKNNRASSDPQLEHQTHDGGLPESINTISELASPKAPPLSYPGGANSAIEAGGVPIHEMKDTSEHRYEAKSNSLYPTHGLTAEATQPGSPPTASPRSPTTSRKPLPQAQATTSSFPRPWDSSGAAEYEQQLNKGPSQEDAAEDAELAQLEAEVVRVKQGRERLEKLQALKAREEELKRTPGEEKSGFFEAMMFLDLVILIFTQHDDTQ
jgi:hypothetical protein